MHMYNRGYCEVLNITEFFTKRFVELLHRLIL